MKKVILKGHKLYSIIYQKCPRCHRGYMFTPRNPYQNFKFSAMNEKCFVCGKKFEIEVGFFYGAMYVSYFLTVMFSGLCFLTFSVLLHLSIFHYFIVNAFLLILFAPVTFRLSRLIWINFFVNYDPSFVNRVIENHSRNNHE